MLAEGIGARPEVRPPCRKRHEAAFVDCASQRDQPSAVTSSIPQPAEVLARRLLLPVSNDNLLRAVRCRAKLQTGTLRVIGIDEWAWRRNHRAR